MPGHSSCRELILKLSHLSSRSSQCILPSLSLPICEMGAHCCRVKHSSRSATWLNLVQQRPLWQEEEYWKRLRVVTLGPPWSDILVGAEGKWNFRKEALDAERGVGMTPHALGLRSSCRGSPLSNPAGMGGPGW